MIFWSYGNLNFYDLYLESKRWVIKVQDMIFWIIYPYIVKI